MKKFITSLFLSSELVRAVDEPNPPTWADNVKILDPKDA